MYIGGEWYVCQDASTRPIIRSSVLADDGTWIPTPLLIDTGADRTVLNSAVLGLVEPRTVPLQHRLAGIGGAVDAMVLETTIRLLGDDGAWILFRGQYAALPDPRALDMSVLGRDILDLFAVLLDWPGNRVCLLSQRHRYRIEVA